MLENKFILFSFILFLQWEICVKEGWIILGNKIFFKKKLFFEKIIFKKIIITILYDRWGSLKDVVRIIKKWI